MRTFPYNISQNLIGYAVFRKHPSLSKTHTCENIESTVCKNCDPLFSLMTPILAFLWVLWALVYEILVRTLTAQHTTSVKVPLLCTEWLMSSVSYSNLMT